MSAPSEISRFAAWRLNAPDAYRWTKEDVLYEKTDSFINGVVVGILIALAVFLVALLVFA